jgi:LmbE family N-acetylglucosaminyl deacetylase
LKHPWFDASRTWPVIQFILDWSSMSNFPPSWTIKFFKDNPSLLKKTTHLAIGAHPDDLEIMAYHGISKCYDNEQNWFTGVVTTNGASSSRNGPFKNTTDSEMVEIRKNEQMQAAETGQYGSLILMGYTSSEIKSEKNTSLAKDIQTVIELTKPDTVYLHNLADSHDTHVATALASIKALRNSKPIPKNVYGCEVWRSLDWLDEKVVLDCSENLKLSEDLCRVFESQIAGGKNYDQATMGRRKANATFLDSGKTDSLTHATYAMDLLPLINDPTLDPEVFCAGHIHGFLSDVKSRIGKYGF